MNKYLVPAVAVLALALVGGCNKSEQATQAASAASSAPAVKVDRITGAVTLRDPIPLHDGARLEIKLVDLAQEAVPVAETTQPVSGLPPYAYSLDIANVVVDPAHTYEVRVLLIDGDRRFIPSLVSQVLTKGGGSTADVVMKAEPTPGELLKEEIDKLQKQIGGMKPIKDSYLNDTESVAWDGFHKDGHVRFVRVTRIIEGKDPANPTRTMTRYAYKDDKPMGVIAGSTTYGWTETGELLVNVRSGGGEGDAAAAKSYYAEAQRVLTMAQAKVPPSLNR